MDSVSMCVRRGSGSHRRQEAEAAPVPGGMHLHEGQRTVRGHHVRPAHLPQRCGVAVSQVGTDFSFHCFIALHRDFIVRCVVVV